MSGFLFGTVCLIGLLAVIRRAAWARHHGYAFAYGGGCGGRHGGHGRYGRRGGPASFASEGFTRAAGEVFKRRLRIDEEQEGIIDHALIDLRSAVKAFADALKESRAGFAGAFRGETVDDAALAATFTRHDDALAHARRDVVSALKQVHAVLTPEQRAMAADWLAAHDGKWV